MNELGLDSYIHRIFIFKRIPVVPCLCRPSFFDDYNEIVLYRMPTFFGAKTY